MGKESNLDQAKKIWPDNLGWIALRTAGLETAAIDFILTFHEQVSKEKPGKEQSLRLKSRRDCSLKLL